MFQDKDTSGYNSLLEAHPLDPFSGFNTKDGKSTRDEMAFMHLGSIIEEVDAERQAHVEKTGAGKMNMQVDMSWIENFDEHLKGIKRDIPVVPTCLSDTLVDLWTTYNTELYNVLFTL
jgi:hypothetical protein